jgi:hypothetical protein
MNKILKMILNILIFILILGFGYYMIHSLMSEEKTPSSDVENQTDTFASPYKKANIFNADSEIQCFAIFDDAVYVALSDKISVFGLQGNYLGDFAIEADVRDIVAEKDAIYLLYATRIVVYSFEGEKVSEWEACSENTDYCAFTTVKNYVFVTDAENKHLCQYDKQGQFVRFIKSPDGFIIPSYSFDVIAINDTLYCSNSGRHRIESYTLDGEFITSVGVTGTQVGAFSGCCNPVYLEKSPDGNILTSEKGNPRISCYGKNGKFRAILFDSNTLGGGTTAYKMCVSGEKIYIANGKTITVYCRDAMPCVSTEKSCTGCKTDCPLRKKY